MSGQDIDHILRTGSNEENSLLRICAMYRLEKGAEAITDFLRREYLGGKGFYLSGEKVSVWFGDEGILLAKGETARYAHTRQLISWEQAERRIGELLEQGEYITQDALSGIDTFERTQLANALWNLHHDLSDEAKGMYFDEALFWGGHPDSTSRIAELLAQADSREILILGAERLLADYAQNRDLLRFHNHRHQEHLTGLRELALPRREYTSTLTDVPSLRMFITQDEADAALAVGSGTEGGKLRIHAYFTQEHNLKEKADFLKNEFGTGGRSHALSGASDSWEDHGSKGIEFRRGRENDVLRLRTRTQNRFNKTEI